MSKVKLTPSEVKDFMKHIISCNQYLQESGKLPIAINIEGPAGIGKTSVVKQVREEMQLSHFERINVGQLEEIGDMVGFPVKEYEFQKEGSLVWVDEKIVDAYLSKGYEITGRSRMGYAVPEKLAGKGEGGILLLDDYTRGDARFQQACMEVTCEQEYHSWKLPKNWHVILN